MSKRSHVMLGLAAIVASASCTVAEHDVGEAPGPETAEALTSCSGWSPEWSQGSGANNWWAEYTISGSVSSAWLDVEGRASVPLEARWGKWGASTPRIATAANVVLRALDSAGRTAQTQSFRYLVDTAPQTAGCTTCTRTCAGRTCGDDGCGGTCGTCPSGSSCSAATGTCAATSECSNWNPAWAQGSGANSWWVEYVITDSGDPTASAYLEVAGRDRVALTFRSGKWAGAAAKIATGTSVVLNAQSSAGNTGRTDAFRYLVDLTPKTATCTTSPGPGEPDGFAAGEVDVVSSVKTTLDRHAISPLIYGLNSIRAENQPASVMRGVSFLRRGGDRSNTYNWETNISNGSRSNGFVSDAYLAQGLAYPNAPGELDRVLLAANRGAGRGTMLPFVLNDYVAGPVAGNIPYDTAGWDVNAYFHRVELVKPTAFVTTPDLNDGVVYTDEHINFLKSAFVPDIFESGPTQLMVGSDNEPDLYAENLPMLQRGTGRPLLASNGVKLGNYVTGDDFTARFVRFAKRVKSLWPTAPIIGPDHYHYDGWTTWWGSMTDRYSDAGRWYMDDFLAATRQASETAGRRLLDTWDFHWYPQRVFGGTYTWALDNSKRAMTQTEIDAVVQGPRSYWDTTYDEHSWITDDHLHAPAYILTRLQSRLAAGYPGTKLGVTEYFPGGCAHVSSALGVVDTLGVFGRVGVNVAAMWPHDCDLRWAFGGFKLVRNADGGGLRFANTSVRVEHPEIAASSLYAASDDSKTVTVLVVNKTNAQRRFGVRLYNPVRLTNVDVYRVDAAHPDPYRVTGETVSKNNAYAYAGPAMSATLLVFRAP